MKQKKKNPQEEQLGWQFVYSVAFLWTVKKRIKGISDKNLRLSNWMQDGFFFTVSKIFWLVD